jgi:hypothetical protein
MPRIITVDFTGVEVGGGMVHIPEDDYGLRIVGVKGKKGEESGKNYLAIQFKVFKGNKRGIGKTLPHSCSLQKQSLWNLRNLFEACGKQTKAAAVKIDLDKMIGLECAGSVIDDEYEGRKKSVITAFFPLEDLGKTSDTGDGLEAEEEEAEKEAEEEAEKEVEEEAEVEEKPAKTARKKGKAKPKEVEEAAEEESEEAEEDLFS